MIILSTKDIVASDVIKYPNIYIPQYKVTFITGPSGCGKTTLFKIFNRTFDFKEGEVFYKNNNILNMDPLKLRKSIILAGQDSFLFEGTTRENFQKFYEYRDIPQLSDEQIQYYLKLTLVNASLDTLCETLSGGQRHRIFISIMCSFKPDVILLDEPTAALDENTASCFLNNIINFCKLEKITPVIISHSNKLTQDFADHIINLGGHNE